MERGMTRDLITKFITKPSIVQIPNKKIASLYDTFRLDHKVLLPREKPPYVNETPFQFHSSHNGNTSYVTQPRLSVTKLLTESWCELRDYYTVYSGSMVEPKTESLLLGTKYHEELEQESFEAINIGEFEEILRQYIQDQDHQDSELALDWVTNLIFKLYTFVIKSETRELLVHGYLDLESQTLESHLEKLNSNSVLVSGVIDHLRLYNKQDVEDLSMFEEIQLFMDGDTVNLQNFFVGVSQIIDSYKDKMGIKITDVKTRRVNYIPTQESVLKSSYLQVCYYKQFFQDLSNLPQNTYNLLLHNAKARNCDLDEPIHPFTVLGLLRMYPELLLEDFKTLARGDDIGFEPFDSHSTQRPYDLSQIPGKEIIRRLSGVDEFDYLAILNDSILCEWKKPPTLRYFASRSAQFFGLFKPFNLDDLSIEYHNIRSRSNFKTLEYKFNKDDLENSVISASNFWNGYAPPRPIDDISKCKYCDFNFKCSVPNKDLRSFGTKLNSFLS